MEVHRQTCQNCGSLKLKNILAREPGEADRVFVQCHDCKELVARYIIDQGGYYHYGKGFESYIRGLSRGGEIMSGKNLKSDFETRKVKVFEAFEKVQQALKETNKED
jgi:hypothetical protein